MMDVSRAETPARRTRMGSRSKLVGRTRERRAVRGTLRAKDVARSPDRMQQTRLGFRLELAAKVGDENLDRVRRGEGVVPPDLVEQALARDDDPLVAHQVFEQLELTLGELDWPLAPNDLVGVHVQ